MKISIMLIFTFLLLAYRKGIPLEFPGADPMITNLTSDELMIISGSSYRIHASSGTEISTGTFNESIAYGAAEIYKDKLIVITKASTAPIKITLISLVTYTIISTKEIDPMITIPSIAVFANQAYIFGTVSSLEELTVHTIIDSTISPTNSKITIPESFAEAICAPYSPHLLCILTLKHLDEVHFTVSLRNAFSPFQEITAKMLFTTLETNKPDYKVKDYLMNYKLICRNTGMRIHCLPVKVNEFLNNFFILDDLYIKTAESLPSSYDVITIANKIIIKTIEALQICSYTFEYTAEIMSKIGNTCIPSGGISAVTEISSLLINKKIITSFTIDDSKVVVNSEDWAYAACKNVDLKVKLGEEITFKIPELETLGLIVFKKTLGDKSKGDFYVGVDALSTKKNYTFATDFTFKTLLNDLAGIAQLPYTVKMVISEGVYGGEIDCIIQVIVKSSLCWTSCDTCSIVGDETNHQCETCNVDYYKINDNTTSNCYMISEKPDYALVGGYLKKCNSLCLTCSTVGTGNDHQCLQCIAGYNKFKNDTTFQCYSPSTAEPNWVLVGSYYQECSSACKGCTEIETSINGQFNTFCKECASGAYVYGALPECRNSAVKETNIVFDSIKQQYVNCYVSCASCSAVHDKNSMNCINCIPNKRHDTVLNNCMTTGTFPQDGFYQGDYGDYYPCYSSCKSCSEAGTNIKHNCLSCSDPSHYFIQDSKKCIPENDIPVPNDGYFKDTVNKVIVPCFTSCSTCDGIKTTTNHFCLNCADQYYKQDISSFSNCFSASDPPEGLYLDQLVSPFLWKSCPSNCIECLDASTCLICKETMFIYQSQCYSQCPGATIANGSECLDGCAEGAILIDGQCYSLFDPDNDMDISITSLDKDDFIGIIEKNIDVFVNESLIFKGDDYLIQIFDKKNEGSNQDKGKEYKLTTADVDNCLKELARHYTIDADDIIIMKIDLNSTDSPTNKVEFIYYDSNNNRLDARNICKDTAIKVIFPIVNTTGMNISQAKNMENQVYDAFDPENEMFNDICTPFTTETGVDVTLSNRREDLYQNVSMCQGGCAYNGTNLTDMTASCSCKGVGDITLDKLVNDFVQEIFSNNFFVVTCYELLLDGMALLSNLGFMILGSFLLLNTSFVLYIMIKGFGKYTEILKTTMNPGPPNKTQVRPKGKVSLQDLTPLNLGMNPVLKEENEEGETGEHEPKEHIEINIQTNSPRKQIKLHSCKILNEKDYEYIEVNSPIRIQRPCSNNNLLGNYPPGDNLNSKVPLPPEKHLDCIRKEDDDLSYLSELLFQFKEEISLPYSFCGIYWSTLKEKHSIWVTFCSFDYLELKMLQVMIFFNSIAIDFSLNALFYSNAYIDQRYADNGALNFIFSLPKSIFSFLLGIAINFVLIVSTAPTAKLKKFVNESMKKMQKEDNTQVIDSPKKKPKDGVKPKKKGSLKMNTSSGKEVISKEKTKGLNGNDVSSPSNQQKHQAEEYLLSCQKIIKETKCRLSIFLVLNYIMMLLFLYYVSCFCAVQKNSQVDWIIGCAISFSIAMGIPFIMSFLIGCIKWICLKCKCQTLYVFNEVLSNIL